MQLVNAAATFALMVVVLTVVEFRDALVSHDPSPIRLTASAVNMSAIATSANATVDINIERWSSEAEQQKLMATFHEKGPERLLDALQTLKRVGYIRMPDALGYDLYFARQLPIDGGGRRIIIATDRRIGLTEARHQPQSADYPFTLIEIRLKPDGTAEGKMAVATPIGLNRTHHTVELEDYSSEPVRLQHVTVEKR